MNNRTQSDTLRAALIQALGPVYPGSGLLPPRVIGSRPLDNWQLDDLTFTGANEEPIPAYFLRPPDGHPAVPGIIYAHAHGNNYTIGRAELIDGRPALHKPYAEDLAAAGIAALVLDLPCFGDRQTPGEDARAKAHLWRGQTLFGQMLAELRGGVDFLTASPVIDATRIGVMGFSMGSTLAWWLAGLDPRLRAAAALCSFADIGELIKDGTHDHHGNYMTVPGQIQLAPTGEIAGLVAPRALTICVGDRDPLTPPPALQQGLTDLENAYHAVGAQEALSVYIEAGQGHVETAAMRQHVLTFLKRAFHS